MTRSTKDEEAGTLERVIPPRDGKPATQKYVERRGAFISGEGNEVTS